MVDYKPPAPKVQQQDLKGKVALVIGASKGIGRAITLDLSTRGCSILGTYTSLSTAHHFDVLSHTIHDLYCAADPTAPKIVGCVADITKLSTIGEVLKKIESEFGNKIDILVLNASFSVSAKVGQASESDVEKSLTGNLQYPIVLVENLVRQNIFNPNSRVVIMSSFRVRDPGPGSSLFVGTRAGLEALARCWAVELPLTFPGTTVNAVNVGLIDTPGLRGYPADAQEMYAAQRLPRVRVVEGGRLGQAEDVADVVGWLVSEKARWTTGSVVAANGGAEFVGGSS